MTFLLTTGKKRRSSVINLKPSDLQPWYDFFVLVTASRRAQNNRNIFHLDLEVNSSSLGQKKPGTILMSYTPIRFINEPIEVQYNSPPMLEKKPGCPHGFTWRERPYTITEVLSEWHVYERSGRMEKNMKPASARKAVKRGSWGVGQDYYRVRTEQDRIFEIYYDSPFIGFEKC